jgi:hypothetical protein
VCRATVHHAIAIECIDADAIERRWIRKLVHRQVIRVGPDAELWIITEVCWVRRIDLYRVQPPPAGNRIACLANTNALPEGIARKCGKCKIADHPPVSHMVVEDYPVAVIIIVAAGITRTQRGKE